VSACCLLPLYVVILSNCVFASVCRATPHACSAPCVTDGELTWPACTYETGRWPGWDLVEYMSHSSWWFYDVRHRISQLVAPWDTSDHTHTWWCSAAINCRVVLSMMLLERRLEQKTFTAVAAQLLDDASVVTSEQGFLSDDIKNFHVYCFTYLNPSVYCFVLVETLGHLIVIRLMARIFYLKTSNHSG